MYTDLPKVTAAAETFKTDINMMQSIKIKLLRGGVFSTTNLLSLPVGNLFSTNSVDLNIGTSIHLVPRVAIEEAFVHQCILKILGQFILQNLDLIDQLLSPMEKEYLWNRLDMFFYIESFPGCYVIRI